MHVLGVRLGNVLQIGRHVLVLDQPPPRSHDAVRDLLKGKIAVSMAHCLRQRPYASTPPSASFEARRGRSVRTRAERAADCRSRRIPLTKRQPALTGPLARVLPRACAENPGNKSGI